MLVAEAKQGAQAVGTALLIAPAVEHDDKARLRAFPALLDNVIIIMVGLNHDHLTEMLSSSGAAIHQPFNVRFLGAIRFKA